MYIDAFVQKYNGKKVDFDGVYGAQCVDLFRQYCKEGLDIPEHTGSCATTGGALDLYVDYPKMPVEKKYFIRGSAKKGLCPGDVLVWDKTAKNPYGHVAIYLGTLNNSLIVFEQNGITQNGAEITLRSKENMLGYLRRR